MLLKLYVFAWDRKLYIVTYDIFTNIRKLLEHKISIGMYRNKIRYRIARHVKNLTSSRNNSTP